jgi:hypothetical protein
MNVKIKNLQTIYQGFLTLEKATLQFEKFSGGLKLAFNHYSIISRSTMVPG